MSPKKYIGIDYFRIAAAILVIAIHTSPLLSVNDAADFVLTRILARTAVPFFFMVTGFFLCPQNDSPNNKIGLKYKGFIFKNIKLYFAAALIYLPLNFYAGYFSEKSIILKIIKDILSDGTFYHLWYFPAVILGVCITAFLLAHLKIHIAGLIAILLYIIGLFGDSYYGLAENIPLIKSFYDILFSFSDYTRNGLFFAPVYLFMGVMFSKYKIRHSFVISMIGFLASMSLLLAEGLLLYHFSMQRHDSMYVMLIPCMYFLFQLLIMRKGKSSKDLRMISMLIYIMHPWCIVILRAFAKIFGVQQLLIENSVINFTAVSVMSVFSAIILISIFNKIKTPSFKKGRAWAEINLSNLKHNALQLKSILPGECEIMAVVKADAYGHGDIKIASELQKCGINAFAAATLAEGIHLRKNGIKGTILILGYTYPEEIAQLVRYRLTQTIVDYSYAVNLNQFGKKIKVHIKIDTGMNRLGESFEHLGRIAEMFQLPNLIIDGMYTHLCCSDSLTDDDIKFTAQQIEDFYCAADRIAQLGYYQPNLHIQSSYGVLNYPELHCSYARVGIALYGLLSHENDNTKVKIDLRPVLSIKARISNVKNIEPNQPVGYGRQFVSDAPMKIASVTIGYADGIPRNLKNGCILVSGIKAKIIGNICMDQLIIDVTDIPDVKQSDIVTVIGEDGGESISGEEISGQSGTITNEFFSRLGSRLEKVYISI